MSVLFGIRSTCFSLNIRRFSLTLKEHLSSAYTRRLSDFPQGRDRWYTGHSFCNGILIIISLNEEDAYYGVLESWLWIVVIYVWVYEGLNCLAFQIDFALCAATSLRLYFYQCGAAFDIEGYQKLLSASQTLVVYTYVEGDHVICAGSSCTFKPSTMSSCFRRYPGTFINR